MEQQSRIGRRQVLGMAGVLAGVGMLGSACAPSGAGGATGSTAPSAQASIDADFHLDALIAAAKKEGSLNVYDSSGDITNVAKGFAKKYGIDAVGTKSKSGDTLEKLSREHEADNVTIDVALYDDGPTLVGQLLAQKVVMIWMPADLQDKIPEHEQNPLVVLNKADVFVYNDTVFPDDPPISNLWELTTEKWRGRFSMQDPLGWPKGIQFFNQLTTGGPEKLADAYAEAFDSQLQTDEDNAAWEWIKRLAKNEPILTKSDEDSAAAVGAPNQKQPRLGLMATSKFRDIDDKGYHLRVLEGLKPWPGLEYPKFAAIATKTKRPNAAKLFVHYVLTQKGIAPEIEEGGASSNTSNKPGPMPPGLKSFDPLFDFDSSRMDEDFTNAQKMQDFWRANHG
jgi:iron(III) transport system substrate-binding protein